MLSEPYQNLLKRLATHIPASRLITDPLRTLAYGSDASFYRLIPKVIVKVENETEVRTVLKTCRELKLAVTFRAAGTSLSGQAISESVLLLLGIEGWRNYRINSDGSEITLGAGILGADANTYLAPYGKKTRAGPSVDQFSQNRRHRIQQRLRYGQRSGWEQHGNRHRYAHYFCRRYSSRYPG